MRTIALLGALVALLWMVGCEVGVATGEVVAAAALTQENRERPRTLVIRIGNWELYEFQLDDGTRCIAGRQFGVSCDWRQGEQ